MFTKMLVQAINNMQLISPVGKLVYAGSQCWLAMFLKHWDLCCYLLYRS